MPRSKWTCILALDLGTTAFKAAAVAFKSEPVTSFGLVADPIVVPYRLDYAEGRVTCDPERYYRMALEALRKAVQAAETADCRIQAIGISSQAQTYIALDRTGAPLADAVVWTDNRAVQEAEEASRAIPDTAALCGFRRFSGQQFLPKVMHLFRKGEIARGEVSKFLLLNEYIVYRLTGKAYGDETNQGMGGFYDITARAWSTAALELAGTTAERLASIAPAAGQSEPLRQDLARLLNLDEVPVFVCGNDQTCAAAGAEMEDENSVLCNFGTAMVVYTRKEERPLSVSETQIAGIDPLTARYFLLGLEPECGNVLEWLAGLLYPQQGVEEMLRQAVLTEAPPTALPRISLAGGGRLNIEGITVGSRPETLARSLLEYYAARFAALRKELYGSEGETKRLIASGGLAQSQTWLDFLAERQSAALIRSQSEHPGLIGVARIISHVHKRNHDLA
jgi:xylulokinase